MDLLTSFLGRNGYLPHGYCFTWSPGLLWSMVGADTAIALAYFSIPMAIVSFTRRRADVSWSGVAWLFSAFIFACGITHLMDIWTVWRADYGLQAVSKVLTAAISVVTALALWRLIPGALRIPSVRQLQAVIQSLEAEIGKRRSAEEHLVDVQQSLAVTLASIGAGFVATDREGRVVRMNAVAEQLLGRTVEEAQGRSLWEVFERTDRPPAFASLNPVDLLIERQITVDDKQQVVAIAADGTQTPLELRAAVTHSNDGSVRGLAMVFRDLTPLLRAEAESGRLAAIVESSSDAIISKTLDGRITSWNGAAQSMFGYSAEEAIGQNVQMLLPADRAAEEMRILANLARGERVPTFDTVRLAKDGHRIDVSITVSPVRDTLGRIVGASKIARDVSAQRRAEAALRESNARLHFTLEAAQVGDWDLDLATGLARRSPRHDRCFGYDAYAGDWRFETFAEHLHPDDRAEVERSFRAALAGLDDWRLECRVVWPDGSLHWIGVHGSFLVEGGRPTHLLGIVIDITPQRLAEDARRKARLLEVENQQIQEASRLKSQFLANMSHELRTPLNAVIGFADLLHGGAIKPDNPKHREYLGHIAASGRHLLQLINDVLDLAKVESGKFEFFPEPVQLPQLVKEVGDILHTARQRKNIEWVVDIAPELGPLRLDPARLKQVLYNYLSNAIKFTPEGGCVTLRARPEGPAHFRLEVEDTGIGITEADLARLFVEFQQLDSGYSKQHQGTGLGLALTRRLVEAQGGSVGVRSTPGQGSVFHLVLARQHDGGPGDAHALLIVEPDAHHRGRLAQSLSDAGFRVDTAATGEAALIQAQAKAYDAITLDLKLPDQPGLGVLASIRRQGPSSGAAVIGMTLATDSGEAAAFAIADMLHKPLLTGEVVAALGHLRRPPPQRACVMVIDDDPLALDLMAATLTGMGIGSIVFESGREALAQIGEHRPDAIILDLMMPGFDGFEVLDALHRLPAWRETPVFVWTSMVLSDGEYASLSRSAQAIVSKGGGALPRMLEDLRRPRRSRSTA
jgi:PAS domain S-box-containing protein